MSRIFACDACHEEILAEKPRIHCQVCRAYDLCANCFVCEKTSRDHGSSHATMLFEMSGYVPRPPPMPPRPALPQRPSATQPAAVQRRPVSMQVPSTASISPGGVQQTPHPPPPSVSPVTYPHTTYPAPPPLSPGPSPNTTYPAPPSVSPAPSQQSSYAPPPPPGPSSSPLSVGPPVPPQTSYPPSRSLSPQTTPSYTQTAAPAPSGEWQPLFNGSVPTAFGLCFFNVLFARLDTTHTGLLRPEQYSAFLTVLCYGPDEDVWKKQMSKPAFGFNREDLADYELKQAYVNFSVDHRMAPRNQPPNTDFASSFSGLSNALGGAMAGIIKSVQPAPISGGMMPMLTRQGFVDISTFEFLYDPNAGWNYMKLASRHYGIWREWGECPRSCLPMTAPQELLDRTKIIQIDAHRRAEEMIAAKRIEASLAQQGREAALDIVSGPRYVYR